MTNPRQTNPAKKEPTVDCICDGCGKKATCTYDQAAPPGWFYTRIMETDDDTPDDPPQELITIVACTEACKSLKWEKQE